MMIDVLSGKGGTGKTTLAMQIAGMVAKKYRVGVLDFDAQRSASDFYAYAITRGELSFIVSDDMKSLKKCDLILVDHPPAMLKTLGKIAVLTIQPSFYDVSAARKLTEKLSGIRVIDVLNRWSSNRADDQILLDEMKPAAVVRDRSIYRRVTSMGLTIASPEVDTLYSIKEARAEIAHIIKLFN